MIRYALRCDGGHEFDGWFPNSTGFDEQVAAGEVACPVCASLHVSKAIMSPAIGRRSQNEKPNEAASPERKAAFALGQALQALRAHVEKNCDYVGNKFAEEARKIHYGETEHRDIYGEATLEEARELIEEGVEAIPLPKAVTEERH